MQRLDEIDEIMDRIMKDLPLDVLDRFDTDGMMRSRQQCTGAWYRPHAVRSSSETSWRN
jgi:hypothetical protein